MDSSGPNPTVIRLHGQRWRPLRGLALLLVTACALAPMPSSAQPWSVQDGGAQDGGALTDEPDDASGNPADSDLTPEELAREAERALDMFLRDQKVLFLQGEIEFELSVVNTTDTQINARLGPAIVPEFQFRSTTASLLVRYALTDDLEVNLFLPAVTSERDYDFLFLNPVPGLEDDKASGLGDVRLGLRYQLLRERGGAPDMALSLEYKTDTGDEGIGTNDDSVSLKSTFVKTIDPVVFFAEFGYNHTFENEDVDAGNELFMQLGTGFSVNDRVSFNAQYIARSVGKTEVAGAEVNGSERDIANLQFGVTTQLTKDVFLEPFLSVGLTEDAADVSIGLSVPF